MGLDADLAIVDLHAEREMTREDVLSSAGYSIYEGVRLRGQVTDTLVRGRAILRDGALVEGTAGHGRYQRRVLER